MMCADIGQALPGMRSPSAAAVHMRAMTEKYDPETTTMQDGLEDFLLELNRKLDSAEKESEAYLEMETHETVERLIRHMEHRTTQVILDGYHVLTGKFGLEDKEPLYDYLFEVPMRFRLYREAFNAETHVGCVDRAVAKVAEEIQTAGDADVHKKNQRFDKAGLAVDGRGSVIGTEVAADALILAEHFDDSRRIQRLSCDTRAITQRILDSGADVDPAKLAGTVRLILGTAAEIAHEQDGLETS